MCVISEGLCLRLKVFQVWHIAIHVNLRKISGFASLAALWGVGDNNLEVSVVTVMVWLTLEPVDTLSV